MATIIIMVGGHELHLHQEWHDCGKEKCRFCRQEDGTRKPSHGPYWYGWYRDENGKRKRCYTGNSLPFH